MLIISKLPFTPSGVDVKLAVNRVANATGLACDCSILSQFKLYLGSSQSDISLRIWAQLQHFNIEKPASPTDVAVSRVLNMPSLAGNVLMQCLFPFVGTRMVSLGKC